MMMRDVLLRPKHFLTSSIPSLYPCCHWETPSSSSLIFYLDYFNSEYLPISSLSSCPAHSLSGSQSDLTTMGFLSHYFLEGVSSQDARFFHSEAMTFQPGPECLDLCCS